MTWHTCLNVPDLNTIHRLIELDFILVLRVVSVKIGLILHSLTDDNCTCVSSPHCRSILLLLLQVLLVLLRVLVLMMLVRLEW